MSRLEAFLQITMDGYYADAAGDMSFAHRDDAEWQHFVRTNAREAGLLLFGRTTYELMSSWWPTPAAAQAMPEVAARMNAAPKLVFSRTLERADWSNTTIARDCVAEVRRLKGESGADMTILGSGSIVTQLAAAGLVDTLQLAVVPLALGGGKRLLDGIGAQLPFALARSRTFRNGSVVLWYEPR
ncbi:MAG TPA: dihydrofolate reductase family protein [Thermoanaerobaculia bacterium]|jgi:dihydrofolate reductase